MSISTGPQQQLERRRRARIAALAFSVCVHTAIAALIVWSIDQDRQKVGSEELDIELVAPRLATPLEPAGQEAEDPGRAKRDGDSKTAKASREDRSETPEASGEKAQAAQASEWQRKIAAKEQLTEAEQKLQKEQKEREELERLKKERSSKRSENNTPGSMTSASMKQKRSKQL
jgi:hypothetical protein